MNVAVNDIATRIVECPVVIEDGVIQNPDWLNDLEYTIVRQACELGIAVTHCWCGGLYIRESLIPAGCMMSASIGKTEHPSVLAKGTVRLWTAGEEGKRIEHSYITTVRPKERYVLYAVENAVTLCLFATNEKLLHEFEREALYPTNSPYFGK